MTESFKQALYNKDSLAPQILIALENTGQIKDMDGDKDVDQDDVNMVTKDNYDKIVKGILSDRKAGAEIYSQWWAATEGQAQFDKGYKTRNLEEENEVDGISLLPTKGKSTKTDIFNNRKWTPNSNINAVGLKINNREPIPLSGGEKFVFFEDENTYFLIDNEGKRKRKAKDKNDIFTNVFGGDENGVSGGFKNSDFYQSVLDFGKKEKLDLPKDMLGEDVPGGIYAQTLQSSTGVIEKIQNILIPSAVVEQVRQGLNPDYYGDRDRIRVTIPDADGPGKDYVYEFDAGGNSDAVNNAKAFNSNLKKYFK